MALWLYQNIVLFKYPGIAWHEFGARRSVGLGSTQGVLRETCLKTKSVLLGDISGTKITYFIV